MLNIEKCLLQHFQKIWKKLIEYLYISNDAFMESVPHTDIVQNALKYYNDEFEEIQTESEIINEYLNNLADEIFKDCSIFHAQIDSIKSNINGDGILYQYCTLFPTTVFYRLSKHPFVCPWKTSVELAQQFIDFYGQYYTVTYPQISSIIQYLDVSDSGIIHIYLEHNYVLNELYTLLVNSYQITVKKPENIIINFPSSNMTSELDVTCLKSIIAGDVIARYFEFMGHSVKRVCTLYDFSTPTAILICYYKMHETNFNESPTLNTLHRFYTNGAKLFKEDKEFSTSVYNVLSKLYSRDPDTIKTLNLLCSIVNITNQQIYNSLDIQIECVRESSYVNFIPEMITDLQKKNIMQLDDKWEQYYHIKIDNFPPFVVCDFESNIKSYTNDTYSLIKLKQQIQVNKANRIYYVIRHHEKSQYDLLFNVAKTAKYYEPSKCAVKYITAGTAKSNPLEHTEDTSPELIQNVLDTSYQNAFNIINNDTHLHKIANKPLNELKKNTQKLSKNCVKYFDLRHNLRKDYNIDYEQMFNFKGDTFSYVNQIYCRMLDIYTEFKNANTEVEFGEIIKSASIEFDSDEYICEPVEMLLAVYILQFPSILELVESKLNPHILIEYIYSLSQVANNFYNNPSCISLNISTNFDNSIKVASYNRLVLVICYLKLMNTLAQLLGISFLKTM